MVFVLSRSVVAPPPISVARRVVSISDGTASHSRIMELLHLLQWGHRVILDVVGTMVVALKEERSCAVEGDLSLLSVQPGNVGC